MIQSMTYFQGLAAALNTLYQNSYQGVTTVSGMSTRVFQLLTELDRRGGGLSCIDHEAEAIVKRNRALLPPGAAKPTTLNDDVLAATKVDVFSPDGSLLARELSFSVPIGCHMVIEGPNGAGKSSLLRTIGGLWPLTSGTLATPGSSAIAFVPQQAYICNGSLRDQIIYPDTAPESPTDRVAQAAELDALMIEVGLSDMVHREGGWDVPKPYSEMLSGGERQRLAIARVLYHQPRYAILDEATASVSKDIEIRLVQACIDRGITIISVSHRPHLRAYHKQALRLLGDGQGGWEIIDISASFIGTIRGHNESVVTLTDG